MIAKEYLSQALLLDQRIHIKLEHLTSLRALATKMSATLRQDKVSGGNTSRSRMENAVVKIVDLEKEINEDIDHLVDLKAEIRETISQIEDPIGQVVLEMRYINGKGWDDIARGLRYNNRSVFKIHSRALRNVSEIKKRAVKFSKGQ
ncbi:MAG TPA: DUF1492 domain-containing protein [Firmicutes bacterium]|nr:DUF1492 domain-containing protein [Bacillota bacterium]